METRIDFLKWLSTKLYLATIGFYGTICLVMTLPTLSTKVLETPQLLANFAAFFIVVFLRAAYESLVIYETPAKSLSLGKMLILTFVTSSTMALMAYFLKPKLGYFSIPIALVISMVLVGKLKSALWPTHERPGFFHTLPLKLSQAATGRYIFFGFLVGIAYLAVGKLGCSFSYSFTTAYFIGMLLEEAYNTTHLYEQPIKVNLFIPLFFWALCCALLSTALIITMMKGFSFSGQIATITSVIMIKLIQPLGSRKFIWGR